MSELELERVLVQAATRTRINVGLGWACAALGVALVAATVLVVSARIWPAHLEVVFSAYWVPFLVALAAALLGVFLAHPSPRQMALELDRRARLEEHLTTWEDFRRQPEPEDPLSRAFVHAQRKATLRRAEGLDTSLLLPIRLPAWSRVLWLGVMAVGCAILMKPLDDGTGTASQADARSAQAESGKSGERRALADGAREETFHVNPLSVSDIHMAKVMLANPNVPESDVTRLLEQLEAKIGSLRDAELSEDARRLILELRKRTGSQKTDRQAGGGSRQHDATAEGERVLQPLELGVPPAARLSADAIAIIQDQFHDLAEPLARYYGSPIVAGTGTESHTTTK